MKSVLIVTTRQIGDVLLTTPLIHKARQLWPDARVDVLGFKGTLGMLRLNPDINELIETPAKLGWRGALKVLKQWRRYDLALIAQSSDRAHIIGWISARRRSGIVRTASSGRWLKNVLLNHVVPSDGDTSQLHVVQENLLLLSPWLSDSPLPPKVIPPRATELPESLSNLLRSDAIVVHAPSMWPYKQWPVRHFQQLIQKLTQAGHQVVLTGSASATDQQCIQALRGLAPSPQLIDASGLLNSNQLTTLFQKAALYIGPDTSITHLAASCGIRTLALFGPTNPVRWGPWPCNADTKQNYIKRQNQQTIHNVTLLQGAQPCVPCSKAGCEDHTQSRSDCLISMSPERVYDMAESLLNTLKTDV